MNPTTDPAEGAAPLVQRLVERHGARWVPLAALDDFLATGGDQLLFFHGQPLRFPEGVDVAVVLPELQKHFGQRWLIGVVPLADEDAVAARFGVQRWPSLVLLRGGRYLGTLSGMRDWSDYVHDITGVLASTPTRPPGVGIRVVGPAATSSCA